MDTPMPESAETVEESATDTPETDVESTDVTPEGADALGDAGKRALDAMKAERKTLKAELRELKAQLAAREKPASEAADQPDADAIRREATQAANARILKSEVKAAAKGVLTDPADAFRYLDMDAFDVDDNGDIDADEIADAIQELVTNKPYLAAATARRFQGTGDGGAARKASGPSQLTRAEMVRMSPEQIVSAKAEGRLNTVLGIK